MTAEEESFWKHLESNPTDNTTKLVFADWLQEQGQEDLARCIRCCVRRKRWPKKDYGDRWSWGGGNSGEVAKRQTNILEPPQFLEFRKEERKRWVELRKVTITRSSDGQITSVEYNAEVESLWESRFTLETQLRVLATVHKHLRELSD